MNNFFIGEIYVYQVLSILWILVEIFLIILDIWKNKKLARDHGTLWWLTGCIIVGFYGSAQLTVRLTEYNIGIHYFFWILGLADIMIALGIFLRLWVVKKLGKLFRRVIVAHQDEHVFQNGLYQYIRHPSYLGITLAVTGIVLGWGNIAAIIFSIATTIAGLYPRIILEEQYLQEFMPGYSKYINQVKWRLIPLIW